MGFVGLIIDGRLGTSQRSRSLVQTCQLLQSSAVTSQYPIRVAPRPRDTYRMTFKSVRASAPVHTIPYIQLLTAQKWGSEPQIRYRRAQATVIYPNRGIVIEGELLDCPEREDQLGWVVLRGRNGTVAAGSPALKELMIENSPCHLCLESVCVRDSNGFETWDWLAFELSPSGARIQVSDDPTG